MFPTYIFILSTKNNNWLLALFFLNSKSCAVFCVFCAFLWLKISIPSASVPGAFVPFLPPNPPNGTPCRRLFFCSTASHVQKSATGPKAGWALRMQSSAASICNIIGDGMIREGINQFAPVIASAGLYGFTESEIGKALLILMVAAVVINQFWTVTEKIIRAIRSPLPAKDEAKHHRAGPAEESDLKSQIAALKEENASQDKLSESRFKSIGLEISNLRRDIHRDGEGTRATLNDVLKAIGRLEGKTSQ